jgi:hypothetical protein
VSFTSELERTDTGSVLEQRSSQIFACGGASSFPQKYAANDPVRIYFKVRMAEPSSRLREDRNRQPLTWDLVVAPKVGQQGQYGGGALLHRACQRDITFGRVRVGFSEQNVESHGTGTNRTQAIEQCRVYSARPRPAPQRSDTCVIDGNDDHV